MPPDLLMPGFVLVLVANAVLIVFAMRALMTHSEPADPPAPRAAPVDPATARRPPPDGEPHRPGTASPTTPATPAPPDETATPTETTTPSDEGANAPADASAAAATTAAAGAAVTKPATRRAPATPASRSKPSRGAKPGPAAATPATPTAPAAKAVAAGTAAKGRRRRFALPPEEDHEKVNRSIESFLAGGDVGADAAPDAAPTTVAMVALAAPTAHDHIDPAVAQTLERELRAAARGTDRVQLVAPARWQVTLAATGELAARAYLRAVRSAIEPALDGLRPPLRLVATTATVLDEPVAVAVETAGRRLVSALGAPVAGSGLATEPRAAGD
jgi:hypothetical protein